MSWPLVGREELRLRLAMATRPHHAQLLTGPSGVGKRRLARWLARGTLCSAAWEPGGCGECGACRRVEAGTHADLLLVGVAPGKTKVSVDDVRRAIGELELRPLEGRGRVAVFEEADRMSAEAQNSLLKTLEEPHPDSWIVLTAARAEALLDTVRSRAERVAVPPASPALLAAELVAGHGATPELAARAAALAGGSFGTALVLLEMGLEEAELLCRPLLDGESTEPATWARAALSGVDAEEGSLRAAKVQRARQLLDLTLALLRERGGQWLAMEETLTAREDLEVGLGPELVLLGLYGKRCVANGG